MPINSNSSSELFCFIFLDFDGVLINMHFEVYRQSGEVYFHLGITSKDETNYDVESFYKKMLTHAIETSELKGSVFSMSRNELDWQKISMQKRDFNDIFLPQTNIEDLKTIFFNNDVEPVLGKVINKIFIILTFYL